MTEGSWPGHRTMQMYKLSYAQARNHFFDSTVSLPIIVPNYIRTCTSACLHNLAMLVGLGGMAGGEERQLVKPSDAF